MQALACATVCACKSHVNVNFAMTLQSGVLGRFIARDFYLDGRPTVKIDWPTLKIVLPHCRDQDPEQLVGTSLCIHLQSVTTLVS